MATEPYYPQRIKAELERRHAHPSATVRHVEAMMRTLQPTFDALSDVEFQHLVGDALSELSWMSIALRNALAESQGL